MKPNFEFADPYRFLVSAGIILIAVGLLLPWLLLQVSLDIVISTVDFDKLTSTAQEIVTRRQNSALWLINNVGMLTALFAGLGFVLVVMGLIFWVRRYRQQEALAILEERRKRFDAERSLPTRYEHLKETTRHELGLEATPYATGNNQDGMSLVGWWEQVNTDTANFIRGIFLNTHHLNRDLQIGKDTYFLLTAKQSINPDALLKLKPVLKPQHVDWYVSEVGQTIFAHSVFKTQRPREIVHHTLFIPQDNLPSLPSSTEEEIRKKVSSLYHTDQWDYQTRDQLLKEEPKGYAWAEALFQNLLEQPLRRRTENAFARNAGRIFRLLFVLPFFAMAIWLMVGLYNFIDAHSHYSLVPIVISTIVGIPILLLFVGLVAVAVEPSLPDGIIQIGQTGISGELEIIHIYRLRRWSRNLPDGIHRLSIQTGGPNSIEVEVVNDAGDLESFTLESGLSKPLIEELEILYVSDDP